MNYLVSHGRIPYGILPTWRLIRLFPFHHMTLTGANVKLPGFTITMPSVIVIPCAAGNEDFFPGILWHTSPLDYLVI